MKKFWNTLVAIVLVLSVVGCSMPQGMSNDADVNSALGVQSSQSSPFKAIAPSPVNPGNFATSEVPMFVSIGWDDNRFSGFEGTNGQGGMRWALDFFANKKNPGVLGTGVYDGTPARNSFFQTGTYGDKWESESNAFVRRVWNEAHFSGHETGNHSFSHPNDSVPRSMSASAWLSQMQQTDDMLTRKFDPNEPNYSPSPLNGAGIPAADITGWRTPHLGYNNNTFVALKSFGLEYDCSINEGFQSDQDGTNFLWPYSLEDGSPGNKLTSTWDTEAKDPLLGSHPGIYELPVYALIVPPDDKCVEYGVPAGLRDRIKARKSWFDATSGKVTGFDYNMWFLFEMTKEEVVATLKYSFDLRYNGNRAPFMLGAHTDYYSSKSPQPSANNSTYIKRQQAIEEFMNYVMSKPDVRVVPFNQILEWCKNPKPLRPVTQYDVTATAGANGTITPTSTKVYEGGSVTFTAAPAAGYVVDTATLNNTTPITFVNNKYELKNVTQNTTLQVSFKLAPTYTVTVKSGANGSLDVEGIHKIAHGGSLKVTAAPAAGYKVGSAVLGTTPVEFVNNVYTIENVTSDVTLDVSFVAIPVYTVTVKSGPNGVLDVEGTHQIVEGGSLKVTASPDAGYKVDTALLGTTPVTFVNNVYTIENVKSDLTLDVTFAKGGVVASYTIGSDWGSGFGGSVIVTNNSDTTVNGWTVTWTYQGDVRVTSLWNASFNQTGKTVTVSNLSWNGTIAPGKTVSFGFNGAYTGANETPVCTVVTQ